MDREHTTSTPHACAAFLCVAAAICGGCAAADVGGPDGQPAVAPPNAGLTDSGVDRPTYRGVDGQPLAVQSREERQGGVVIETLRAGEGEAVEPGDLVTIRYRGSLEGGTVVDESTEPRGPWPVSGLVPGLADGVRGMRVGGVRRVTIPPERGYGDEPLTDANTGEALIPPGSTMNYVVELVDVRTPASSTK